MLQLVLHVGHKGNVSLLVSFVETFFHSFNSPFDSMVLKAKRSGLPFPLTVSNNQYKYLFCCLVRCTQIAKRNDLRSFVLRSRLLQVDMEGNKSTIEIQIFPKPTIQKYLLFYIIMVVASTNKALLVDPERNFSLRKTGFLER